MPGSVPNPVLRQVERHVGIAMPPTEIRADSDAQRSVASLDALAFTQGRIVSLGQAVSRDTAIRRRVVGHELVHVAQQHHHRTETVQCQANTVPYPQELRNATFGLTRSEHEKLSLSPLGFRAAYARLSQKPPDYRSAEGLLGAEETRIAVVALNATEARRFAVLNTLTEGLKKTRQARAMIDTTLNPSRATADIAREYNGAYNAFRDAQSGSEGEFEAELARRREFSKGGELHPGDPVVVTDPEQMRRDAKPMSEAEKEALAAGTTLLFASVLAESRKKAPEFENVYQDSIALSAALKEFAYAHPLSHKYRLLVLESASRVDVAMARTLPLVAPRETAHAFLRSFVVEAMSYVDRTLALPTVEDAPTRIKLVPSGDPP